MSPAAVVLLGAQRFDPTLSAAVAKQYVTQRMAIITAGWQELEGEDDELKAHLAPRETVNLMLHARSEEVFREDPELRAAHRERQDALRHRQDFYRIRVEHAVDAARVIEKHPAPPDISAEQNEISVNALRDLDAGHLAACARLHADFEARWSLKTRPSVARHRKEIAGIVKDCAAIAIAGGHVATLTNRLFLFGLGPLAAGRIVFAWSGGAMAISDRIVLFHDDPPQGPGASEVLDAGLGLLPGVVVLPQPEQRLDLTRRDRVRSMARRFSPARCLALPARSSIAWSGTAGGFTSAEGVIELRKDGSHERFEPGGGAGLAGDGRSSDR